MKGVLSFKKVYLIIISIFTIDFLTTLIALKIFPTGLFVEKNPIARWFFDLGWYGWVGNYLFMLLTTFVLVSFVFWLKKYDKKKGKTNFHQTILIWLVLLVDGYAIVNNITLMVTQLI